MAGAELKHVLDGYKVLDFTQVLAGPTVTRLMAEMGAEIIKVELAPTGDLSRALPFLKDGRSAYFIQQNRGKKSLCIDAKNPRGVEILKNLVKKVEVVVENYAPGTIQRLGLDYETGIELLDAYFHCHEMNIQMYSASKGAIKPKRSGTQHYAVCPIGLFKGKETYLFIMALPHQWAPLCKAMGRPELAEDPRFVDNTKRVENMAQVVKMIEGWLASTSSDDEAVRILEEARIPVAPVLSIEQAVHHPHLRYRHTVRTVTDRAFGELEIPGMPLKFSEFPDELFLEAPFLGEHNEEVLHNYLSYTPEQVRVLESQGVLRRAN